MCFSMHQGPPFGVPIPDETHEKFPPEVKAAWEKFDGWWKQAQDGEVEMSRSAMPADVRQAMETIKSSPIPDSEGYTGADSCYMVGVEGQLED